MPVLRASRTPQLWILAADDLLAPSAETAKRILTLRAAGREFTLALFSHAGHGVMEYEMTEAGQRIETRVAEGYDALIRDFAMTGALAGPYGAATIAPSFKRAPAR